ncbi:DUF4129 domain-containing protein [Phytoactinopolyspora mesophila]|uniref:DUF4129 domain-containing protein n=1 Tax=Phytoactinopolyspora mesophila TaxID=2650750 RepID=A0A7K3M5T1_9ACTN|nr:DUF4129 domain-containing protein [Phytoactinopolyspora mesophila]NDL58570.1 DUF4129 domain-containing protein [Phytoactinopolyspora mesophila]
MTFLASAPVELDREEAQDLARHELSQPGYQREASLPARVLEWILEQFNRLISGASDLIPGGLAIVLIMVAIVTAAVLVVLRTGPLARRKAASDPIFAGKRRTAADHRKAADAAADAGDWTTAVLERFRGVVVHLEERVVIDHQVGRTADEAARSAGERLPEAASALAGGARLFDQVLYGGRQGTSDDDAVLRELDRLVRGARPQEPGGTSPSLAVPR